MKKLILVLTLAVGAYSAQAQMGEKEQKAMMDYATPGKMHGMMAKDNGNWTETITMWMNPSADPIKTQSKVKVEMIMDGRYQVSTHSGEMMGMPFKGMSTTGYDNARQVFVNTWVDNFGTGIMTSEGKWDQANNSIEFKGMCTDPMSGKAMPFRQVLHFVDNNTQRMEMYMEMEGKEFKSMEIVMKRA